MSGNSVAIIKIRGLPLNSCKTMIDFFKGMYDVLEAHRWAVAEHMLLHRDISHANIVFESKNARNIQKFNDARRPVFINEILRGEPAPPMARLLDMENSANLGQSKLKPEGEKEDSDKPLRYRTGTPKFIARSSGSKRLRKTGDDGPLAALAELKRAWVDSQAAPVPPDALEYGSEDESEGENASG
ncbi:hypothetical protein AB1N83_011187 [Pleurotus pulmonarius]